MSLGTAEMTTSERLRHSSSVLDTGVMTWWRLKAEVVDGRLENSTMAVVSHRH